MKKRVVNTVVFPYCLIHVMASYFCIDMIIKDSYTGYTIQWRLIANNKRQM